jgi:hypothetical protein
VALLEFGAEMGVKAGYHEEPDDESDVDDVIPVKREVPRGERAGKPADYWDPWVKRQRAKHECNRLVKHRLDGRDVSSTTNCWNGYEDKRLLVSVIAILLYPLEQPT